MELCTKYVTVRNGAFCHLLSAVVSLHWMFINRKVESISDLCRLQIAKDVGHVSLDITSLNFSAVKLF